MSERYSREHIEALYSQPFLELVFQAAALHRQIHPKNQIQWSTLLSIKTGGCPEDCGYCAQSAFSKTKVERQSLLDTQKVVDEAREAKNSGSTRFCMGAAWRKVADRDLPVLEQMVRSVKEMGLETCMTLGTLTSEQASRLQAAGLDYYNHNLDTSREHYGEVVTTRSYDERLETLRVVRESGIKVCCGGILGLGESKSDHISFLAELANLPVPPESVPINALVPVEGTPMAENYVPVDPITFVRVIATARILMPHSWIRLSAGRESFSDEQQALCFLAGANSIFAGEKLLTAENPSFDKDVALFAKLGLKVAVQSSENCSF